MIQLSVPFDLTVSTRMGSLNSAPVISWPSRIGCLSVILLYPHRFSHTFLRPFVSNGKVKSSICKPVPAGIKQGAEQGFKRSILLAYVERRSRSDNATDGLFRSRHIFLPRLAIIPPIAKSLRACLFKHGKAFIRTYNSFNPFFKYIYNLFCMLILRRDS